MEFQHKQFVFWIQFACLISGFLNADPTKTSSAASPSSHSSFMSRISERAQLTLADKEYGGFNKLFDVWEQLTWKRMKLIMWDVALARETPNQRMTYSFFIEAARFLDVVQGVLEQDVAAQEQLGVVNTFATALAGDFSGAQTSVKEMMKTLANKSLDVMKNSFIEKKAGKYKKQLEEFNNTLSKEEYLSDQEITEKVARYKENLGFGLDFPISWLRGEAPRSIRTMIWVIRKLDGFVEFVRKLVGRQERVDTKQEVTNLAKELILDLKQKTVDIVSATTQAAAQEVINTVQAYTSTTKQITLDTLTQAKKLVQNQAEKAKEVTKAALVAVKETPDLLMQKAGQTIRSLGETALAAKKAAPGALEGLISWITGEDTATKTPATPEAINTALNEMNRYMPQELKMEFLRSSDTLEELAAHIDKALETFKNELKQKELSPETLSLLLDTIGKGLTDEVVRQASPADYPKLPSTLQKMIQGAWKNAPAQELADLNIQALEELPSELRAAILENTEWANVEDVQDALPQELFNQLPNDVRKQIIQENTFHDAPAPNEFTDAQTPTDRAIETAKDTGNLSKLVDFYQQNKSDLTSPEIKQIATTLAEAVQEGISLPSLPNDLGAMIVEALNTLTTEQTTSIGAAADTADKESSQQNPDQVVANDTTTTVSSGDDSSTKNPKTNPAQLDPSEQEGQITHETTVPSGQREFLQQEEENNRNETLQENKQPKESFTETAELGK